MTGHKHHGRLTPWTFGYTPGTKSDCLSCGASLVWTVGAKRMYWRLDPDAGKQCETCGRRWFNEHVCRGAA